jgi:hypothetical protein
LASAGFFEPQQPLLILDPALSCLPKSESAGRGLGLGKHTAFPAF